MSASSIASASPKQLSSADRAAAFKAAGYSLKGKEWRTECGLEITKDDERVYSSGVIEEAKDVNGDGRLEAIITEGSLACYGMAGVGFNIVSKQADGSWKSILANSGRVHFLETKGAAGWPDAQIVGPGLCDGVWRWNGNEYDYKCSKEAEPRGCSWLNAPEKICK